MKDLKLGGLESFFSFHFQLSVFSLAGLAEGSFQAILRFVCCSALQTEVLAQGDLAMVRKRATFA